MLPTGHRCPPRGYTTRAVAMPVRGGGSPISPPRDPRGRRARLPVAPLLLTLVSWSCSHAEPPRADPAPAPQTAKRPAPGALSEPAPGNPNGTGDTTAPAPKAPVITRGRELMSTYFELSVAAGPQAEAALGSLLESCLDEVERLEALLSEWQPGTPISEVNRRAGSGRWVQLSEESLDVVQAGLNVSVWSGGAYDLSWAALRGLYRFDGTRHVPSPQEIAERLPLVGYRDIELSRSPPRLRLKRKGMAIGTGGIAKGYALDRVAARLRQEGYPDHLLFAGGQVQVSGSRGGRPWRVGIQHPRDPRSHIGFVELSQGSVSTSGDYEHAFVQDGVLWHHILDLKTGYPARRSVSVTLIAPEGIYADALSTACFVLGPEDCAAMLKTLPFQAEAVIIDPDLRVHVSAGLQGKVVFTRPLIDGRLPPI